MSTEHPTEPGTTPDTGAGTGAGTGTTAGPGSAAGPGSGPLADPTPELMKLLELATKHPEIGPPLAELAFKIGHAEFAQRVVRLGTEGGAVGLEYYFVAANAARREGRAEEALAFTIDAARAFAAAPDSGIAPDDGVRLLHLVRFGFATLLFDLKDVMAAPTFVRGLAETLPALEARLGSDPLYRTLLAQVLWYEDKAKSEQEWERAAALDEIELTWNARGTWYKEAEHDLDKAERAYRQGLEQAGHSAILLHNLAQLLVDKAGRPEVDIDGARRLLRDADDLLRAALREDSPKGLRRHIHATKDRLNTLRASLPPSPRGRRHEGPSAHAQAAAPPPAEPEAPIVPEKLPEVGDVLKGRIRSLTAYGAFVSLGSGRQSGLLHKSEMAYEFVADPAHLVKVGDELEVKVIEVRDEGGRVRIGLSRKALLPPPAAGAEPHAPQGDARGRARPPQERQGQERQGQERQGQERQRQDRGGQRQDRGGQRQQRPSEPPAPPLPKFPTGGKLASLGELLLAKLKEQGPK